VLVDDYTPTIPARLLVVPLHDGPGLRHDGRSRAALWKTRKNRVPRRSVWTCTSRSSHRSPVFANSFGWIFTEAGRQPWIVNGMMTTSTGVSPTSAPAESG
jgi:cytochrome d ubiquinol oxidase subunit I